MLSKQEELLLDLIEAIEDPSIKAQKLTLFHQALVKETSKPLYPFTTDNEGITTHPFNQPIKFEFVRSPAPWEIKSLQKASIAKTLSNLTVHNQAQNLDTAKTIDCPFSHNQLSCMHYKYICIPASISFKRKRIFNQPLKILFHSKLSWQEKAMSSPAEKKDKGKVPARAYPQDKRLPAMGQSLAKHEGAPSTSHRRAISLQDMYPMDTYYTRFMAVNQRYISLLHAQLNLCKNLIWIK